MISIRRFIDAAMPIVSMTASEFEALMLEERYTGSVLFKAEYRNGVKQVVKLFAQPLCIRLDNRGKSSDSVADHD